MIHNPKAGGTTGKAEVLQGGFLTRKKHYLPSVYKLQQFVHGLDYSS